LVFIYFLLFRQVGAAGAPGGLPGCGL